MWPKLRAVSRFSAPSLAGISLFVSGIFSRVEGAPNLVAEGKQEVAVLVRELSSWKARAEVAESRLSGLRHTVDPESATPDRVQARVLSALVSERVIVLSAGRLSGAVLGSLVSVGDGVAAKVIESRERVSAAVVEQAYQGPIEALEGKYARLFVVRP
jgi:hypothetical protein